MAYKLWTLTEPGIGRAKDFDSWWDLIGWIVKNENIESLAWNENDVTKRVEYHYYGDKLYPEVKEYWRNLMVTDEFDRIIPPSEIKKAIGEYKPRERKWRPYRFRGRVFTYRFDSVPCTGKRSGRGHNRHGYKNTWVKIADTVEGRDHLSVLASWDRRYWDCQRNWKSYRKTQYKA